MENPCKNCDGIYWNTFEICICNNKILYDIERQNIPCDKNDKKIIPIKKKQTADEQVPLKIKLGRA